MVMCSCEEHQIQISVLLDGELKADEQLELMDHVLTCTDCALFYHDARSLQQLVDAVDPAALRMAPEHRALQHSAAERRTPEPEETAALAGPTREPFWHRLWPMPAWSWAAAAAVVMVAAIGLWAMLPGPILTVQAADGTEGGEDADVTVVLDEQEEHMTEDRFVALVVELLQAGPRYQNKMAEVLRLADDQRGPRPGDAL